MNASGEVRLGEKGALQKSYLIEGGSLDALLLWKPRVNEALTVTGQDGILYRARVLEIEKARATLLVFEEVGREKWPFKITLLQALPEKERMELIIQKTTELGVEGIIPFKSKRSITLEERESRQKKAHKWQEIALKAAKQSRRNTIPFIRPYSSFKEALESVKDCELKIALYEKPDLQSLKCALAGKRERPVKTAALLCGPEGGFEDGEIEEARKTGFIPVSLGKRVLRTETASIMTVGLLQYEFGD